MDHFICSISGDGADEDLAIAVAVALIGIESYY